MLWTRLTWVGVALLSALQANAQSSAPSSSPPDSAGVPDVRACVTAHARGQELRLDQRFIEARAAFRLCSNEVCPAVVRGECAELLTQIDPLIPSIALSTSDGPRLVTARVWLDGIAIDASGLVPLDPGPHTLRAEADGYTPVQTNIVVHAGELRRTIELEMQRVVRPGVASIAPSPHPPTHRAFRVPIPTWIAGATAVLAVGTAASLGASALIERGHAASTCAPFCSNGVTSDIRTQLGASDVASSVAIVAVVVGVLDLIFDQPSTSANGGR